MIEQLKESVKGLNKAMERLIAERDSLRANLNKIVESGWVTLARAQKAEAEVQSLRSQLTAMAGERDAASRYYSLEVEAHKKTQARAWEAEAKVAQLEAEKAHGHQEVSDCGHNSYWTGAYGTCMACSVRNAEARAEKAASLLNAANKINEALDKELGDRTHELAKSMDALAAMEKENKAWKAVERYDYLERMKLDGKLTAQAAVIEKMREATRKVLECGQHHHFKYFSCVCWFELNALLPTPAPAEKPHRVWEYDGAFKCLDCGERWGALPGAPANPPTKCAPARTEGEV